jgi:hypothetical protein
MIIPLGIAYTRENMIEDFLGDMPVSSYDLAPPTRIKLEVAVFDTSSNEAWRITFNSDTVAADKIDKIVEMRRFIGVGADDAEYLSRVRDEIDKLIGDRE